MIFTEHMNPWNSASFYVGNMIMQIDGKRFFLERNFYHKEKRQNLGI